MNETRQEPPTPSLTPRGRVQVPLGLNQPAGNTRYRLKGQYRGCWGFSDTHPYQGLLTEEFDENCSALKLLFRFRKMILAAEKTLTSTQNVLFCFPRRQTLALWPAERIERTFRCALMTSTRGPGGGWLVRTWDLMKDISVCLCSFYLMNFTFENI